MGDCGVSTFLGVLSLPVHAVAGSEASEAVDRDELVDRATTRTVLDFRAPTYVIILGRPGFIDSSRITSINQESCCKWHKQ